MDDKARDELIQRKQVEDSIRQEFEGTLADRVARYLQVKPHIIIPNEHFAAPSTECSLLFRDGHFFGCIALTQAVAEALARFLCEVNFGRHDNVFEKNVEKLNRRGFISDKVNKALSEIWKDRDGFHHLNPNVETDRQILEELAKEKARLLAEVESELFEFEIINGALQPKHPKYWKISGNQAQVFLRLEP